MLEQKKAMRTRRSPRCAKCQIMKPVQIEKPGCICPYIPQIPTEINFWILSDHKERFKPTNTAALIKSSIVHTHIFDWKRLEPNEQFLALLKDSSYFPFVVFPRESTHTIEEVANQAEQKIPAAILLDGTWRQAGKIFRCSSYLQTLPKVAITENICSMNPLRTQTQSHHLSTVEVAIYLLEKLNDEIHAEVLEAYFHLFLKFYQAARATKPVPLDAQEITILKEFLKK